MDPKLVTMLADYMEKTGSISAETRHLVDRMYRMIERQDQEKTASVSAIKDRAVEIAKKMAGIRLMAGKPLIEGYDMVKQAMTMMTDHNESLHLMTMILDAMQEDHRKQAALEPGRGVPAPKEEEPSAIEGLMADCGIVH
ncbi:MAG: hypothetical protein FWD31_11305 [Planctomycetaceae bacterium]|nr:hypothetical protein [Planctomycetaceae bacterium]